LNSPFSTAGGSRDEALVAFDGDIGGIGGKPVLWEAARHVSDESLQKAAEYGSRLYRGPYFFIARPGTYGSSGHHLKDRRTLLEIRIAVAALDVLKGQYGFNRFHLVGQSGGGHTVAGLAKLRSDIGCAAITSGVTSLRSMQRDIGRPIVGKHRFYDPVDHVHAMKQRPGLRLLVISDRNDKFVSYRSQLEFVERAKAHNLPITHVTATATDKHSHSLFADGHRLAVDCANKARDQDLISKGWDRPAPPAGAFTVPKSGEVNSLSILKSKAVPYAPAAQLPSATVDAKPVQDRVPHQSAGVDTKPVQDRLPQDPPTTDSQPAPAYALTSTTSTPVDFAPIKVRTVPILLYGEKSTGPSELPADAVRPKPERADTIKPLSPFSRGMPGMYDRLTHQSEAPGPKPVQDPLTPQLGGLTPSKTAADPKAAAKPTANASIGGFSLTPSIKLPSVGSFAPASAAFALDYTREPLPSWVKGCLSLYGCGANPMSRPQDWDARYGKLPPWDAASLKPMEGTTTPPPPLEVDPWPNGETVFDD
jgi:hypothetical protein